MHIQNDDVLLAAARGAAEASYSPYSNFRVGAAVLTESGEVITGCNVENAAYGSSICAEANAITSAVAQGERSFVAIAVACVDAQTTDDAYPCGICRQLINEFGIGRIIVSGGADHSRTHGLGDLLPHGFKLST